MTLVYSELVLMVVVILGGTIIISAALYDFISNRLEKKRQKK